MIYIFNFPLSSPVNQHSHISYPGAVDEVIDLNTIFNDFNINYQNNRGSYLRYEGEEVLLGVVRDRDHQVGLAHHLPLPALHRLLHILSDGKL